MVVLKCKIYDLISLNRIKLPARTKKGNSWELNQYCSCIILPKHFNFG